MKRLNQIITCCAIGLLLFTSCSKDSVEEDQIAPELAVSESESDYQYAYQGKFYSASDFEKNNKDLVESSFQIFDETEIGNIIHVFDKESEADQFVESTDEPVTQSKGCRSRWEFKVRMWEHERYGGRWIQFRRMNIPGDNKRKNWNMPRGWQNRVSSILVDELSYPANPNTANCAAGLINFVCYEQFNFRGRETTAVLNPAFHFFRRSFPDLRRGNWNDKINSFVMYIF